MKLLHSASALAVSLAVGACVPQAAPPAPAPPPPVTRPAPPPASAPAPAPTPSYSNWMDAPRTPGDWFYKSAPPFSFASYGKSATDFGFVMRCDSARHSIALGRVSSQTAPQQMVIRSESAERSFTALPRQGSIETLLAIDLPAADPLLDAIALSKGRFAVEVAGEAPLYLPSWPEVSRLIEDCR